MVSDILMQENQRISNNLTNIYTSKVYFSSINAHVINIKFQFEKLRGELKWPIRIAQSLYLLWFLYEMHYNVIVWLKRPVWSLDSPDE